MNLNIFPEKIGIGNAISQELGITEQREEELLRILYVMHKEIGDSTRPVILVNYYKRIAAICNTLEEYTMCMHLFIFYLARHGMLRSEKEEYEKETNPSEN